MYNKLTRILLGVSKTAQKPKLSAFSFKLLAITILAGIQLLAGMGAVHAGTISNNTAGVVWSDHWNISYGPAKDTAAIYILTPPTFIISKDARNIRTGETSSNMVMAVPEDMVEFTVTITNTGDTEARRIVITDTIPFKAVYQTGSALETASFIPNPPDTIAFQHSAGGVFDSSDTGTITAVKWMWDRIDGIYSINNRAVKFRVKVLK